MVKFVMAEMLSRSTAYKGITGKTYVIHKHQPFEVTDKKDIKYFKKKRQFKKVGLLKKPKKAKVEPDVETKFLDELEAIKGISKKIAKKIVEIYVKKDKMIEVLESNSNLGPEIPKKAQNILIAHYLKK